MGFFSIIIIWIFKTYLFPEIITLDFRVLENYVYTVDIQGIIPSSIMGLITRLGLQGVVEAFFEDSKMTLVQVDTQSNTGVQSTMFAKDNGEGSSSNQPIKKGGNIGPEDYTYDSDSDFGSHMSEDNETESKATGDSVPTFKNRIDSMDNKNDVTYTKEEIQRALDMYKTTGQNVPAYKEQVSNLEKKVEICETKLSELQAQEQLEGKGKGKATVAPKRVAEDTSAGPAPKRVPNPNYQPVAGSRQAEFEDYYYNSEDEQEAIRQAIEESLKQQTEGESSKGKGKGKGKDD
jgi:hypothetical protein